MDLVAVASSVQVPWMKSVDCGCWKYEAQIGLCSGPGVTVEIAVVGIAASVGFRYKVGVNVSVRVSVSVGVAVGEGVNVLVGVSVGVAVEVAVGLANS